MPHDDALQLRALLGSLTARLPLCCLGEIHLLDAVLAVLEIVRGGGDRAWRRRLATGPGDVDRSWHLTRRRPSPAGGIDTVTTACNGSWSAGDPAELSPNPPPVERCHACWRAVCGGSVIGMALLGLVEHIAIHDRDIARRREQARDEMMGGVGDVGVRDPAFPCADYDPAPGGPAHCEGDGHYLCGGCRYHIELPDEFAPDRHRTRVASDSEVIALAEVPRDRDPDMEVEIEWDLSDVEEPIAVHGPGGFDVGGEGG